MTTKQTQRGIVLLEAIIAIGVLVMIVGATLRLVVTSSAGVRAASDQVVATYLAQDAAEWLVARRAYNEVEGLDWLEGIDGAACSPNCAVYTNLSVSVQDMVACPGGSCALNRRNGPPEFYTHETTDVTTTPYSRSVAVATGDLDGDLVNDIVTYTITVSWDTGSVPVTVTLYND